MCVHVLLFVKLCVTMCELVREWVWVWVRVLAGVGMSESVGA